jgi:hypothetical protein
VKALVEKHAWEVMCNAEAARRARASERAALFCAFARGTYDDEAIAFFLYCRAWLRREVAAMATRGERTTRETGEDATRARDAALDARQATTVVRSIFQGCAEEGARADASFLHATVRAMIEDAFGADATASWATRRDGEDASTATATARVDGYRLLKMLLSVFVDTTPPADADAAGSVATTPARAAGRAVATTANATANATTANATANATTANAEDARVMHELALYGAAARAAVTEAVGKYVAALFPKDVPASFVDDARATLDASAQDVLTQIMNDDTGIVDEAPAARESFARAAASIRRGFGTPGAASPGVDASSTRDVARAILAAPVIKRAVEPVLTRAMLAVKSASAPTRPAPAPSASPAL